MSNRSLLEAIQLTVLGVILFVVAAVAERRLARLFEADAPSSGRTAPA
jgi:hypothetical protein